MKTPKENDTCPHCGKGILQLIKGDHPYNIDHLMCNECFSTYNLDQKNP